MKKYCINTVADKTDIETAPSLSVSEFTHGVPGYEPRTTARVVYVEGKGFLCRMESEENDLRAAVTIPDGPTHTDSCLEFFVNFAPETSNCYMNLEANPIGTLHCKFGEGRNERKSLAECGCITVPETRVLHPEKGWGIEFFISLETICTLYGRDSFRKGDVIRGNFYKCGDNTVHPHFGMWSRVVTEKPDFHRPEFFGELVID